MKQKRTTLADVAQAAGVSLSTASRALSNHPRIGQQTKKKIRQLAREMDYSPSLLARGLAQNRTFLLGLVVADSRPFYAELTTAIQNAAEDHDYWVLQTRTKDDAHKTNKMRETVAKCRCTAFMLWLLSRVRFTQSFGLPFTLI